MYEHPPIPNKLNLIERAYKILPFSSFADLGGCWGVHGAYAFHAADLCQERLGSGFILDRKITPLTQERVRKYPKIKTVETMLGSQEAVDAVGKVDCLIMFDILLHQVNPDWDQFILNWLPSTQMVVIWNQNWTKTKNTIRFPDQGLEWFMDNIPHQNEIKLQKWFASFDDYDSFHRKRKKDIDKFWQWGIVRRDIYRLTIKNGFFPSYVKNYGPFNPFNPWIVNDGMIFVRMNLDKATPIQAIRSFPQLYQDPFRH